MMLCTGLAQDKVPKSKWTGNVGLLHGKQNIKLYTVLTQDKVPKCKLRKVAQSSLLPTEHHADLHKTHVHVMLQVAQKS